MKMRESHTYCRTGFTTSRRFSAMPMFSYLHQLFNAEQCQAYIRTLRWKDRSLRCPRCHSQDVDPWGSTTIDPGANDTGVTAASTPSTTSLTPCSTGASGQSRTGFLPRFCCVSRARHAASPESWGSIAAPAIGGAGGCAMPPSPMRWTVNWQALSKPMSSTIPRATRGKRRRAGRGVGAPSAWSPQA